MARRNVLTQALRRRAISLYESGRPAEAVPLLRKLCAKDPRDAAAWSLLGSIHAALEDYAAAEACFARALAAGVDTADGHYNLARSLELQGKYAAAEAAYRRALRHGPGPQADAYNNLGNVCRQLGRCEEALECYAAALAADPRHYTAYNNRGVALRDVGRVEEALTAFEAAAALAPDYIEALWNTALGQLALGRFAAGWPLFEWGFALGQRANTYAPYPIWEGGAPVGRRVLVQAEQGVGDEVMYASCLTDLLADAAGCVLECDPRLIPLFQRSFPGIACVARGDDRPRSGAVDVKLSAGSLPAIYRRSEAAFPRHSGYLRPDPARRAQWRQRLDAAGTGPKIGVSWRGGGNELVRRRRSTPLEAWGPVLQAPGAVMVNLQYDTDAEELAGLHRRLGAALRHWDDWSMRDELDAFAALLAELDLIVSVDNSSVHLAGALGRPVLVLLPFVAEWRWMLGREDSPWYPAATLLRQPAPGEWRPVLERAAAAVARLAAGGPFTPRASL